MSAPRFSATTIDHFQHPRNVGRMADADGFGRVDDATTDTMISFYVKFSVSNSTLAPSDARPTSGPTGSAPIGAAPTGGAVGTPIGTASNSAAEGVERVDRVTFRTFGCSACIAASSIATELLVGRPRGSAGLAPAELDAALGHLPADKRYCLDLVVEAARRALAAPAPTERQST